VCRMGGSSWSEDVDGGSCPALTTTLTQRRRVLRDLHLAEVGACPYRA
jgi:hypothetical protein